MAAVRAQLARLSPARRYVVAVNAIRRTWESLDPPPADSPATALLRGCIADSLAAADDHTGRSLPADAETEMVDIVANCPQPGVGPLVLAVANCYGVPESGMDPEVLHTVLSLCYAAVAERELDVGGVEHELASPGCLAAIAMQQELIADGGQPWV